MRGTTMNIQIHKEQKEYICYHLLQPDTPGFQQKAQGIHIRVFLHQLFLCVFHNNDMKKCFSY